MNDGLRIPSSLAEQTSLYGLCPVEDALKRLSQAGMEARPPSSPGPVAVKTEKMDSGLLREDSQRFELQRFPLLWLRQRLPAQP